MGLRPVPVSLGRMTAGPINQGPLRPRCPFKLPRLGQRFASPALRFFRLSVLRTFSYRNSKTAPGILGFITESVNDRAELQRCVATGRSIKRSTDDAVKFDSAPHRHYLACRRFQKPRRNATIALSTP
ncbi:hypothetical protein MTO96_016784 [Rhipicephalus appendiculatus]